MGRISFKKVYRQKTRGFPDFPQKIMAAVSAVIPSSSSTPHHPLLSCHRRLRRSLRCHASRPDDEPRAPQLLKLIVGGATELLRLLSRNNNNRSDREELRSEAGVVARNVDDVVRILQLDYENAYFLTGKFTSDIYADDCLFEDPTIRFRGKDRYSQNLDLLVPFFDRPSLELEQIEKGLDSDMNFVLAKWKLRTYLKFPWRPLISIRGTTTYDLDKEFKVVRHAESWNVSALEAVGQIFASGFKDGHAVAIRSTWHGEGLQSQEC